MGWVRAGDSHLPDWEAVRAERQGQKAEARSHKEERKQIGQNLTFVINYHNGSVAKTRKAWQVGSVV